MSSVGSVYLVSTKCEREYLTIRTTNKVVIKSWSFSTFCTKFDVGGKVFCRTDVEQKFPAFRVEILRIRVLVG